MTSQPLRLGSISFINSLPVDLGLISGSIPTEAEIVSGVPTTLNENILDGLLEVSPVSALWYAEHQNKLLLLPDLSISSESGVQSVLLFSRSPLKKLKNKSISITPQGRTTPALLEIICFLKYGFRPNVKIARPNAPVIPEGSEAILLIGNQALEARARIKDSNVMVTDLAEVWREWTSLPFVFAVWVTRRDFFKDHEKEVLDLHQALLDSKKWGDQNPEAILKEAEAKTGLPGELLKGYFSCLSYDFNEGLKCGLKLYYDYAIRCGILKRVKNFEEIDSRATRHADPERNEGEASHHVIRSFVVGAPQDDEARR